MLSARTTADTARDRSHHQRGANEPMQYLPLFLLFMAVLIAAYFYLQRAKTRQDAATTTRTDAAAPPTERPTE